MVFTNEQNFVNSYNMMVRCSCCNKVLYREKVRRQLIDIRGYLDNQTKKRQIHYCTNCGRKLTTPDDVEYGKYTEGLGNGKEVEKDGVKHVS